MKAFLIDPELRVIKEVEYKDNTLEKPRQPFGKKGKLSRFKDLENE